MSLSLSHSGEGLEIIAFALHTEQFCVKTTSIREIRGWAPVTPMPGSPPEILGVMNLRGTVIPIIDLALKLGMPKAQINDRSAIVVTNVKDMTIGLMVDRVSDILTVSTDQLQPVPSAAGIATKYADGIITHDKTMICYLNLDAIFSESQPSEWVAEA